MNFALQSIWFSEKFSHIKISSFQPQTILNLDDEDIETLGQLFNLAGGVSQKRDVLWRIILRSYQNADYCQLLYDLFETICEIKLIRLIIPPKRIPNFTLKDVLFQNAKIDPTTGKHEYELTINSSIEKYYILLQVFPNGLFILPNFIMKIDDQEISKQNVYSRSLVFTKLKRGHHRITFYGSPRSLLFLQIAFYQSYGTKDFLLKFQKLANLPGNVNKGSTISHDNHQLTFEKYISHVQKTNSNTCPVCYQNDPQFLFSESNNADEILAPLADDKIENFVPLIQKYDSTNCSFSSKMPAILSDGPTLLQVAIFFGAQQCVNELLKSYVQEKNFAAISQPDKERRSVIHFAAFRADQELIKCLILHSIPLGSLDNHHLTVVHYAAMNKVDSSFLQFLFDENSDLFFMVDDQFMTPLHYAAKYGHLETILYYEQILPSTTIGNMNNFISHFPAQKKTPLHLAAQFGHYHIVEHYLQDASFETQFNLNNLHTPIDCSVLYDEHSCFELLFNRVASSMSPSNLSRAIMNAVLYKSSKILKSLLPYLRQCTLSSFLLGCLIASDQIEYQTIKQFQQSPQHHPSCKFFLEYLPDSIVKQPKTDLNPLNADLDQDHMDDEDILPTNDEDSDSDDMPGAIATSTTDITNDQLIIPSEDSDSLMTQPQRPFHKNKQFDTSYPPHPTTPFPNSLPDDQQIILKPIDSPIQSKAFFEFGPYSIGFNKCPTPGLPHTFAELMNCKFENADQVKKSMKNIALIEGKGISIRTSSAKRIIFKCAGGKCNFNLVWRKYSANSPWKAVQDSFHDHECDEDKSVNVDKSLLDEAISTYNLSYSDDASSASILNLVFDKKIPKAQMERRLSLAPQPISNDDVALWQLIPAYLEQNIRNGGKSTLSYPKRKNGEKDVKKVPSFAYLPHYAVLLLKSKAILPVLIIDGTFQCSPIRGVMIIVMTVSSNRTNIPLGWAFGPSENQFTISLILELIKEVQPDIKTIISDDGTALKVSIATIFPESQHKLCAWHLAKKITTQELRDAFWSLVRADHPDTYNNIIQQLSPDNQKQLLTIIEDTGYGYFDKFFQVTESCGINTSSPCESVNSEIRHLKQSMPIIVSHYLEMIGYNRCLDLREIETEYTPYCIQRLAELDKQIQTLSISDKPGTSYGTSYLVCDQQTGKSYEINTRSFGCICGRCERSLPCPHIYKALKHKNIDIKKAIHPAYFTSTIQRALSQMNLPVQISGLEPDKNFEVPEFEGKAKRIVRHRSPYEKKQ